MHDGLSSARFETISLKRNSNHTHALLSMQLQRNPHKLLLISSLSSETNNSCHQTAQLA